MAFFLFKFQYGKIEEEKNVWIVLQESSWDDRLNKCLVLFPSQSTKFEHFIVVKCTQLCCLKQFIDNTHYADTHTLAAEIRFESDEVRKKKREKAKNEEHVEKRKPNQYIIL